MKYRVGQVVDEDFLLLKASVEETKGGKKYIKFNVRDCTGEEIEQCKKWDCCYVPDWRVVHIIGKIDEYAGSQHIIAKSWGCGEKSVGEFSPGAPSEINGKELFDKFKVQVI